MAVLKTCHLVAQGEGYLLNEKKNVCVIYNENPLEKNSPYAVLCEESFGKNRRRYRSFSEMVGQRLMLLLPNKESLCSFSRDNQCAMYEFKLRKH